MIDKMSEVFEISPNPVRAEIIEYSEGASTIKDDSELAKKNIRDLLETGRDALLDMIDVAKASESPRAYEVVATMMRQLADMNSQLLDLYQKEKAATPPTSGDIPQSGSVTQIANQTIFVGTTTELTKALERINDEHSK